VFFAFLNNKCLIISFIKKIYYHVKEEEVLWMGIALFFQFSFVW
jgi:hypothetical protein